METMRNEIIKASIMHFEAHIKKHVVNVENLMINMYTNIDTIY